MATFIKSSTVWVVDFTYKGRPRRWFKAFPEGTDVHAEMSLLLNELYGRHARMADVRPASEAEETQYLRDELPKNMICPTGR